MFKKQGFTLIELLVVIAIISVLAGILFPVFARAKESARMSTCLSNLKQLGLAINMYKEENDSTWPAASALYAPPFNQLNGITLTYNLPPLTIILDPYIKSRAMWKCPSGQRYKIGPDNIYGIAATDAVIEESYAFANIEQYAAARFAFPNWRDSTLSGISDSQFTDPAGKVAMWCFAGMAHTKGGYDPKWMSPMATYKIRFPCLYADSHAKLTPDVTSVDFFSEKYLDRKR